MWRLAGRVPVAVGGSGRGWVAAAVGGRGRVAAAAAGESVRVLASGG